MERTADCLNELHKIDKRVEELLNRIDTMKSGANKEADYYSQLAVYHWAEMSIAIESALKFIEKEERGERG